MSDVKYIRVLKGLDVGLKCKGIWVCRDIMYSKDLTLVEKVIVSIIQGFQTGNKDCFISNQMLADICSCNMRTIIRSINRLKSIKVLHSRYKVINGQAKRILWV